MATTITKSSGGSKTLTFTTKLNLDFDKAYNDIENASMVVLRLFMEDAHKFAEQVTPKRQGGLRASVTKQVVGPTKGIMRWAVNYAAVQEEGQRRNPKTGKMIVFSNYTTPGTHAHFVQEGIEKAIAKIPMYLQLGGLN